MAIQAHVFPDNLGLPLSSHDYFFNNNNFNNNNNMNNTDNVLRNDFLQQLQYHQQQQQYMIQVQNLQKRNSFTNLQPWKKQKPANNTVTTTTTASSISTESDSYRSMNFSQGLSFELEKQGKEIDKFIHFQNEMLKLALQAQMKQHSWTMIKKFEAKTMQLIRQKDDEIVEARKKSMEFQEMINKLEVENQTWQKVALENEAMVISLNNTIEQLQHQQLQQERSSSSSNKKEFARYERKCSVSETGENRGVFGGARKAVLCKVCNCRNASVLMIPCRHLCSCKDCDVLLDACPLCKSPKMASIEALIS